MNALFDSYAAELEAERRRDAGLHPGRITYEYWPVCRQCHERPVKEEEMMCGECLQVNADHARDEREGR